MDNKNVVTGGVKVTYIETQFVTSDEAGFKDLVQRLTGRSIPPAPAPAPHRPRPCRRDDGRPRVSTTPVGAPAVPQGYHHYTVAEDVRRPAATISRTTPYMEDGMGQHDFIDMGDFSDLFCVGASERSDGCYGDGFPY